MTEEDQREFSETALAQRLVKVKGDVGIDATICLNDVNQPEDKELTEYEFQLLSSMRMLIRARINAILEGGSDDEEEEGDQEKSDQTGSGKTGDP